MRPDAALVAVGGHAGRRNCRFGSLALQQPEISFYTLWEAEDLLGFGALKELAPSAGEIKSMRTADAHLRKGVAAAILEHIIAEARKRGYSRLSLETGSGPAFAANELRHPLTGGQTPARICHDTMSFR